MSDVEKTAQRYSACVQAVEAAVSAAVADVEVRTQEEVAAASVAMKAAAEAQQLRELEDKARSPVMTPHSPSSLFDVTSPE